MDHPAPWQHSRLSRLIGPLGLCVALVACLVLLAGYGLSDAPGGPIAGVANCVWLLLSSGLIALAYLLGAIGYGRLAMLGSLRASPHRHALQIGAGLAIMLSLSHLLGMLGLLSGDDVTPRAVAWGTVALGLLLLMDQVARGSLRPERWPVFPPSMVLLAPALGVLLVAACNPPGWLWGSEFGAYDALSYHLQLPKEWACGQRLWPVHHNVYSYLPSFMEAAYLHIAQLMPGSGGVLERLLGSDGSWVIACQLAHAGVGVLATVLVSRCALAALHACGVLTLVPATLLAIVSGALLLSTPWTIVVCSLAYNEGAVLALGAAGCLMALDTSTSPRARGAMCGLLVGAAASAKPTALLILGPTVGLLLLAHIPARRWVGPIVVGSVAGVCVLLPWLIRNAMDSGNPVFPFASGLFGSGHWTSEQIERYAQNHHFVGPIGERFTRLFSSSYGLSHPQFAVAPLLALVALLLGIIAPATRRLSLVLLGGIVAGVIAWMTTTHLQSRFLVPLVIPMVLLVPLGLAGVPMLTGRMGGRSRGSDTSASPKPCPTHCRTRHRAVGVVGVLAVVCSAALCITSFISEGRGRPNALLAGGVGALTGMIFEPQLRGMRPEQLEEALRSPALNSPVPAVNLELHPHDTHDVVVYLLGDGAPLYYLGATGLSTSQTARTGGVIYHTTWDRSPMGDAIDADPDRHSAWSAHLRSLGITHVLINLDELSRLAERDAYFDPRVTLARVGAWASDPASGLTRVRDWTRQDAQGRVSGGHVLYRLEDPNLPIKDRSP